jgi:hypothetical protein
MMRATWTGWCLVILVCAGCAQPVCFTQPPTAVRRGDEVHIGFAMSRPTDVAVTVEDSRGRVLRHLAAGVLGPNAPEPLAPNALAQRLVWDGMDDAGRKVPRGPIHVRVAAGLRPEPAGTAFTEYTGADHLTNTVLGLAAGPDGRCYVLTRVWHSGHWNATSVHVFARDGTYEKTIKPFPAELPPDCLAGIGALEDERGRVLPIIHRVLAMSFYPWEDLSQHMAVTFDGRLRLVVVEPGYRKKPLQYLTAIGCADGAPLGRPLAEPLVGRAGIRDLHLAASSDGDAVYLTGLNAYDAKFESKRENAPCVYRVPLEGARKAVPFFGDPDAPGAGGGALRDPRGVATDGRGHLFVADRGNDRVVVLREADASFVGAFPVSDPSWLGVHRRTGAVYVSDGAAVVKFVFASAELPGAATWRTPREVSRMALPTLPDRYRARTRWFFALDPEAEPAVLWVSNTYAGTSLLRSVESDGKFGALKPAAYQSSRRLWNVSVGLDNREVACKVGWHTLRILDETTGKTRDLRPHGSAGQTYRLGPNGEVYGMDHWKWGVRRWDRTGKSMPFPATKDLAGGGRGRLPSVPSGTTSWERDFCVDREGNIYVKHRGKHYHGRMTVDEYDRDGRFKRRVLWSVSDGALGPRLDPRGNVYLAEAIKPLGRRRPELFTDPLPSVLSQQQYTWMYGSVIKFGPQGGAVWFPVLSKVDEYAFDGEPKLDPGLPKEKVSTLHSGRLIRTPGALQGARWWRFGCAPVLDMHRSHNVRCHCTGCGFDVDHFGRVFYPDQGRFRLVVLDTNGNEIGTIGAYGNQDASPETGVPFGWILGVGVSDRYVYVPDALNRRVVRVKLGYQAERSVPVE